MVYLGLIAPAPAAIFTVSNTNDLGAGSLRQALLDANSSFGADSIRFQIGSGPKTISPASGLPPVTDPVTIDGTTQPGYAGQPIIQLDGSRILGSLDGILILAGKSTVRGLVINRFRGDGIRIESNGTNTIEGNFIGTDLTGTLPAGNLYGGITVYYSPGNWIGGTAPSTRNVISGGNLAGVYLIGSASRGNVIAGNFIGTDATGRLDLGNVQNGVVVSDAGWNLIGGTNIGARNVISGNDQSGIYIMGRASSNSVWGNFIGTDLTGTLAVSNNSDGITLFGATRNLIGGADAAMRNIISGNKAAGILLNARTTIGNQVFGNFIGTDVSGTVAIGNRSGGIVITDAPQNQVGSTTPGTGNLISGNTQSGIVISGTNASANFIEGNIIGAAVSGTASLGNRYHGVSIIAGGFNRIGGTQAGAGNLIAGNIQNGIVIGHPAVSNLVQGNRIGTEASGLQALPNTNAGVRIESSYNTVGGTELGARNVISGNKNSGVYLLGAGASRNVVQGNLLGLNATGTAALPNAYAGVAISGAPGNLIGGATPEARNIISGNADSGVYLVNEGASNNVIAGNFLGTDLTGTASLGNRFDGVSIYGVSDNRIGGLDAGEGNLISGNLTGGVYIGRAGANRNVVQGNLIGTQIDGVSPLGNTQHAVLLEQNAADNQIGGTLPGAGNTIAFTVTSGYDGVRIRNGTGNLINGNSIFSNNGLGVDLGNEGVNMNDPNDADAGANELQNYPLLDIVSTGQVNFVGGTLSSQPDRTYQIDLYVSRNADPSRYGEGQFWIARTNVTTSASGVSQFVIVLPEALISNQVVTATATDPANNTSEFSLAISPASAGDMDGDGLPDEYELLHGFNYRDAQDGSQDTDNDGLSNRHEFRAGTDPKDRTSVLRVLHASPATGGFHVTFAAVPGKSYRIECAEELGSSWTIFQTNLLATELELTIEDATTSGVTQRFYRIVVEN